VNRFLGNGSYALIVSDKMRIRSPSSHALPRWRIVGPLQYFLLLH
jgi:hypothetical protein